MKTKKHPLLIGMGEAPLLMPEGNFEKAMSGVELALSSKMLTDVDVTSLGLPKEVASAYNNDGFWPDPESWFSALRPYNVVDGVLYVPIKGMLMHGVSVTFGNYMTGYDYIIRACQRGEADPNVKSVAFHVNSGGGHVSGCFDTCDFVFNMTKPTMAFVNDYSASAAYMISSQADKIIGTQTSEVGSIGVMCAILDSSKAMDNAGLKMHVITAPEGGDKADGYPGLEVSEGFLERLQASVNESYEMFVATVVRGRNISAEDVRATKAQTFRKDAGLKLGLIDKIGSSVDMQRICAEATAELLSSQAGVGMDRLAANAEGQKEKETEMTEAEKQAMIAQAKAEAKAEAMAEATKVATKAASDRIAGILGSAEAEGREELAKHFAFNTEMDVDAVVAALKVAPKTAAAPAPVAVEAEGDKEKANKASFEKHMEQHAPNLGAEVNDMSKEDKDLATSVALAKKAGLAFYN